MANPSRLGFRVPSCSRTFLYPARNLHSDVAPLFLQHVILAYYRRLTAGWSLRAQRDRGSGGNPQEKKGGTSWGFPPDPRPRCARCVGAYSITIHTPRANLPISIIEVPISGSSLGLGRQLDLSPPPFTMTRKCYDSVRTIFMICFTFGNDQWEALAFTGV